MVEDHVMRLAVQEVTVLRGEIPPFAGNDGVIVSYRY